MFAPPLIALVITSYSWRAVFYVTGLLGIAWTIWWWRAYYSPDDHPRLSAAERQELAPGAQIRDEANRIVVPSAVMPDSLVKYRVDPDGMVQRVWILTPQEAAQPALPRERAQHRRGQVRLEHRRAQPREQERRR